MTEDATRIGWIGCGRMGSAMATRLLAAGYDVAVTNRTREKAERLAEHGATVAERPRDLASCRVVFVMVAADADLTSVLSGPEGLLAGDALATEVVVDCSTVSSETSARVRAALAARGIAFLAAPVSGNPKVVRSGQLTLAVSGPRAAFERVNAYLAALGHGATYVGEDEVARLVKICHNVMLGVVTQTMAEITVLAERGGVARADFLAFLNSSVMGSMFTRYKTPAFVNLDFTPTFTPVLLRKDFELGLAAAKALDVPMPVSALCTQLVVNAIGAGHAGEDFAVLLLEEARNAGLALVSEDRALDDGLEVP